ncbi:tetraacyldisaccharide 4'-kinase [Marinilabilia sp.]|uniref:tetraacyldisaccharide 4'-kinase n=1 Tax=Marinilabilia sp. TaxID=2021252 RepID=UPI0025C54BD2|nr:tetraacyldisaccharide 4'-kinase [Marinilabilia sp.]
MKPSPCILLYPLSLVYCLITSIRNALYNTGLKKTTRYRTPLISIGNLTVGGTGKTPMSELLIKTLLPEYRCALLSRGYGRKTKGPRMAANDASPATIGDEPMQMKLKFPGLTVMVAEKRTLGMDYLLKQKPAPQVVLLDDAFQHRAVTPGLSILVTDYYRPIYKDVCLPAGNLREPLSGKKRADIIIVNKCPKNLSKSEKEHIIKKISPDSKQQVFFSCIKYGHLRQTGSNESFHPKPEEQKPILAIAGIGNPIPFFQEAAKYGGDFEQLTFPDHHDFSESDIKKINGKLEQMARGAIILTTEKDAVRLSHKKLPATLPEKIWYIPIDLEILFNEQDTFIKTVKSYVEKNQRNSGVS